MKLEICASNYQSAINAQVAGAHRIELCTELAVGGLTPSFGLLKQVVDVLTIPVFVLIRPRSGNFTYTKDEFDIMKHDIQLCKDLGCDGIVSGVLKENNTIDVERTKQLIEWSSPLNFTFHRAFDWTPNPFEALQQLIDLKVERILTSGQKPSAEQGFSNLKQLQNMAKENIIVLPGGGITIQNAKLFKNASFKEIHASATTLHKTNRSPKISMNSIKFFDETIEVVSEVEKIKSLLKSCL
ncbi:copper homeostasis protein [Flavobacteriaceae bacterium MAR_2010_72]|nr:copper homeostasis protein [Flavobacteriaceae bacterium MAR_2010_72]TVZ59418.1 copper homeostasis protein [Flavobacteriaceae bacterium MAR_2010_105]